jgi:hypothetical protein
MGPPDRSPELETWRGGTLGGRGRLAGSDIRWFVFRCCQHDPHSRLGDHRPHGQNTARRISAALDARKVWEFDPCSSDRDRAMLDQPATSTRREALMKTAKHTTAPLTTEKLAAILERFAAAQTVVDMNIAAGIALNELRGVDD